MTGITRADATDYQYNLYVNYLDQLNDALIKYAKQTGISIQYWHIIVDLSMNYNDLNIQKSYKHYVYDIYNFVPTINMTPLTYQIQYNQNNQGTSNVATGSFTMYLIDKPLPGDLIRFYSPDSITDNEEIFRVTNARYMRTSKEKLKLFEIEFETAPLLLSSLEELRVNKIWCWDSATFKFLDEEQCNANEIIKDELPNLIDELNKYYDEINGWYGLCPDENGEINCDDKNTTRPLVFLNTIIKRIKKNYDWLDIKPIYGIGTAKIGIDWILKEDYWDTFTCLSFTPEANAGEIFNLTRILNGECTNCPDSLIRELECHRGLLKVVQDIIEMLKPLMTEEMIKDTTCDRYCCDATDPNYIISCLPPNEDLQPNDEILNPEETSGSGSSDYGQTSPGFNDVIWDIDGPNADRNALKFCDQYVNAVCVPLYISWKDGAFWPEGGITG
jgi:hypothetical protein